MMNSRSNSKRRSFASLFSTLLGLAIFLGVTVEILNHPYALHISSTTTYQVQPQDTLWGIAGKFDPNDNRQVVINWIDSHNHINGMIQPGMVLTVPVNGGGK